MIGKWLWVSILTFYLLLSSGCNINNAEVTIEEETQIVDDSQKIVPCTAYIVTAVSDVEKAAKDSSYIEEAEKAVINGLAYESLWTMYDLQCKLNEIKYNNFIDKKKILILGDSITAGMGMYYTEAGGNAQIENAWWQYIDKDKNNVMFLAVGGMGIIQQGVMKEQISYGALDMLKYAEEISNMGKEYDEIIIALSTNDYSYSEDEYGTALMEMLDYLKENYECEKYGLINFYNHEDKMEEVAEQYSYKFVNVNMLGIDKYDLEIDDIHPSSKGQQQIYEVVKNIF
jgi:lysophospholipase L1-like esterase